jgi:uncharacterized protein YjdB
MRSSLLVPSCIVAFVFGCSGGKTAAGIDALRVSPAAITLVAGGSRTLEVTPVCSGPCDAPAAIEWASSDPTIATIDAHGTVSAFRKGTVAISALDPVSGAFGEASVIIDDAAIRRLTVALPYPLPVGTREQLDALGTFDDGATRDVSGRVVWTSSAPSIVEVDGSGVASARSPGTATITARDAKTSASASVVFAVSDAVLQSLSLTPASATTPVGSTRTLVASGRYTDGSTHDVSATLEWVVSDPSIASVDAHGVVSTHAPGTVVVTAAATAGAKGTATVAVTP